MGSGESKSHWFSAIFELKTDFFALLNKQAEKTLAGVQALSHWLDAGINTRCLIIKDLEKEADELKMQLGQKLFESYITPFDREDIYDLSIRLDEVINAAKAIVREMEAFEVEPNNPTLQEMGHILVDGTQHLTNAFAHLGNNLPNAVNEAQLARKAQNRLTKMYRAAIRELLATDDLKTILRVKEVYKSMLMAADYIDFVGEKLLHTVIKMG